MRMAPAVPVEAVGTWGLCSQERELHVSVHALSASQMKQLRCSVYLIVKVQIQFQSWELPNLCSMAAYRIPDPSASHPDLALSQSSKPSHLNSAGSLEIGPVMLAGLEPVDVAISGTNLHMLEGTTYKSRPCA